ncbi:outer membrane protein assembly factor BamB family protein [Streptomyces sp. GQFP]|uniref:outer membrane protein assembly factor BamB family protein n=1 Tax=Streptomyces sp. GQFP TaxID=2907545 RepID=UPI001F207AF5|nr:PQQ-binding-like beta-propeller repeat protein [Streptomyces sp. GQFP]UIX31510.1 PQQ-binding-like beta-propeller repeat protein [Streptomyces sp. GQFP]
MADGRVPLTVNADSDGWLWTLRAVGGELEQPVVVGGAVYVGVPGGRIAALDAGSGQVRWCSVEIAKASPRRLVGAGEVVVVPVGRERERSGFTALEAATGEVRWTRRKSPLHRVVGVGDSTLVLWNDSDEERGAIAGVDALTGETLWEDEFTRINGLVVRGERVILDAGGFRALDARSGEEIWDGGVGHLVGQHGETEDAAVFLSWGSFLNTLAVQASDTGKKLSETRFPHRKAMKHFWSRSALVDGGRALLSESFGRRVRLFAYTGLDQAQSLGSWRLGRWRLSTLREAVCVGDWVYVRTWRHKVYAAQVGPRRGLRRLTLAAPDGRSVRRPLNITAGPGYVLGWDTEAVSVIRDGRVLWAAATDILSLSDGPVPLGDDRVLFRARSGKGTEVRLYCADVATGRRLY